MEYIPYACVTYTNNRGAPLQAGLPATVFCKASQRLANRISLGMAGSIQAEVNFYNQVRSRLDIEASQAAGRAVPFTGAFDEARRQLLSVLAFWTITMNPAPGMPDMQPHGATLEMIRRIATAIDDLDSLDSFE